MVLYSKYTCVLLQEHHVALFLFKGNLQCQLVELLISGCAEQPFVSDLLPAGTQKAAPDFMKGRESPGVEGGRKEFDLCNQMSKTEEILESSGELTSSRKFGYVFENVWSEEGKTASVQPPTTHIVHTLILNVFQFVSLILFFIRHSLYFVFLFSFLVFDRWN